MDRPIKLGEFAMAVVAFIISIAMMLYNRGAVEGKYLEKQAISDMNILQLKSELKELREETSKEKKELSTKIDKLVEANTNLLILLQNKQDRP